MTVLPFCFSFLSRLVRTCHVGVVGYSAIARLSGSVTDQGFVSVSVGMVSSSSYLIHKEKVTCERAMRRRNSTK